jgi:Mor family transcriptional regulator
MVIDQLRGGPAFATKEQRQVKSRDIYDIIQEKENKKLIENTIMKLVDNFGGRRFLGLTPKGKPVFVSFNINKTELRPNIKFSHNLSIV